MKYLDALCAPRFRCCHPPDQIDCFIRRTEQCNGKGREGEEGEGRRGDVAFPRKDAEKKE